VRRHDAAGIEPCVGDESACERAYRQDEKARSRRARAREGALLVASSAALVGVRLLGLLLGLLADAVQVPEDELVREDR